MDYKGLTNLTYKGYKCLVQNMEHYYMKKSCSSSLSNNPVGWKSFWFENARHKILLQFHLDYVMHERVRVNITRIRKRTSFLGNWVPMWTSLSNLMEQLKLLITLNIVFNANLVFGIRQCYNFLWKDT